MRPAGPVLVGTAQRRGVRAAEPRARRRAASRAQRAATRTRKRRIIARAGERGAVTISTNMAGRGVDIRLGAGVAALGGLHVIGTNRHDSRRIDHQLRGRAGRQGDPGSSQFFVSREDPLVVKYRRTTPGVSIRSAAAHCRRAEPRHPAVPAEVRVGGRGTAAGDRGRAAGRALGLAASPSERTRLVHLAVIDDLWSDYLAAVSELRSGTPGFRSATATRSHYLRRCTRCSGVHVAIDEEVAARLERSTAEDADPRQRGATWTYLTTDEPFGPMTSGSCEAWSAPCEARWAGARHPPGRNRTPEPFRASLVLAGRRGWRSGASARPSRPDRRHGRAGRVV